MAGVSTQKNDRKVERTKPTFPRMKVLVSSLAIAGAVTGAHACGGEEEEAPSVPSGGSAGAAGSVAGGSSGMAGSGPSEAGGSTSVAGSAGTTGATSCAIEVTHSIDCESTSFVSNTLEVGDEMNIGVGDAAVSLQFTGAVGRDFQTSEWTVRDSECNETQEQVEEGSSRVVSVGEERVEITVTEIAPDTSDGNTKVTVRFSAVCGEVPVVDAGADAPVETGCEGLTSEEGTEVTLDIGGSVTVGNATFQLLTSSLESAELGVSCYVNGTEEQVDTMTVEAGETATHDLGTHEAVVESIWSNPVQAKIRPSVDSK